MTIVVTHPMVGDHHHILSTEEPLLHILVLPDQQSAKIERFPFYMYFDSLEQAQRLRDMINALLDLNPTIRRHVPSDSAPSTVVLCDRDQQIYAKAREMYEDIGDDPGCKSDRIDAMFEMFDRLLKASRP